MHLPPEVHQAAPLAHIKTAFLKATTFAVFSNYMPHITVAGLKLKHCLRNLRGNVENNSK